MLKIYMLIIVLGLVGGVVYGGWYYYKDTQARIATLQKIVPNWKLQPRHRNRL